ncbi:MAG: alpha/beta fold hydrolase [Hyphomicrobiaceae bacterium]
MAMITLRDGAKLSVETAGSGRPLVLISGLGGTGGFWAPLVEALGPILQTICFDQRGVGGSELGREPVSIRSLAEDTWEIVDALAGERPVLCGHSTGGAIVQEMELARPGAAAGLVLSGTWAGPDVFMERLFQTRLDVLTRLPEHYAMLSALIGSPTRWLRDHPDALVQAAAQTPNETQAAVIAERIKALLAHDCRDRLAKAATPALVLGTEDDVIVPVYLQEELAALLSEAELHLFDKGGHFYPVTRPADMATLLHDWLTKLDGR